MGDSDPLPLDADAHRTQHEHHRQPLDDEYDRRRDADLALHRERAGLEEAEEEPRRQHRDRIHRREQRYRHGVEAEPERETFDQSVVDPEYLDAARDAGEA